MIKILNFVPLLIWTLGFFWLAEYSDAWRIKSGKWSKADIDKKNEDEKKAFAMLWWIGTIFWFIVGTICL